MSPATLARAQPDTTGRTRKRGRNPREFRAHDPPNRGWAGNA